MKILLVGMNHRTAPVEVRERFAVDDPLPWLAKLVASPEIDEAVLISTCNRVEVIAAAPALDAGRHRLRSFFHRELGQAAPLPHARSENAALYEHVDSDAVRHLFRVAASIDSLVVGEPQILGQVKEAYRVAAEGGACGPLLNRLFASAFAASKRVRNETEIASRPVSMARVAVDLARQIFETLEDKRALLIGAGEMIEMALEALRGAGLAGVAVANRTPERAGELAARFGASAHGLDELPQLLAGSDVVLTSIGVDRPLLDVALFEDALRARRRRPIFAIDLGVPRNVDPAVNQLDDVYLYDVDDLGGVAEANAEERRRETVRAEAIVQEEVERFDGWLSALQAVPTIRRLRARAESIRQGELDKAVAKLGLDEAQQRGVEALTRALVNKVLHAPVSRLREQAEREGGLAYLEAAKVLFALDDPNAPGADADRSAADVPPDDDETPS
jgi:glutamyl-tRNA reductase